MKNLGAVIVAAALGLALAGGAANAAVIYDNGSPNQSAGGNEATRWVQAEDFSLDAGGAVGGAGIYIGGRGDIDNWDGTADYFFFADNAGTPGAVLASGSGQNAATTDTGVDWLGGGNAFLLEFDLENAFAAAAGATYWFGIHLSDTFASDSIFWITTAPNGTSLGHESLFGTFDNWFKNLNDHAFFLTADERVSVPEPSMLALLGAGLAGLGLIRIRRMA